VQIVRHLLRVGFLAFAGLAVFCGLVLLFHAQVALNRYAELHASESEISLAADSTGDASAKSQSSFINSPALASAANDALHTSGPPSSNVQTTSPELPAKDDRAFPVRVSNAKIVAGIAAADRQVDVVLAHRTASGSMFSEVVLENVRVLAIEPIAAEDSNERPDIYAVRLDVDAESTDNLLLASQAGTLSLVLHGAKDDPGDRPSESRRDGIPALAQEEPTPAHGEAAPAQDDDPRFTQVRINRVGGHTSTYRVPRER
jgi:Flp pilus assembly protein RcpC/CpaB